jgi:hypothetical protein
MAKQFEWLLSPAQKWERGPELIPGEIYNAKDFPSEVVAEWVRSKAAKYVEEKPKAKTKDGKKGE